MNTYIQSPYHDESKPVGQAYCIGCGHTDRWCYGNLTIKYCNRWSDGADLPEGWVDLGRVDRNGAEMICWQGEGMPPCDEQNDRLQGRNSPQIVQNSPEYWAREQRIFCHQLTPQRAKILADDLGLPVEALAALPIGFDPWSTCYTFAEMDGDLTVGISTRTTQVDRQAFHTKNGYWLDGKGFIANGQRGLTLPEGWIGRPGVMLVCEGPSDVLAGCWAGWNCIGRYSNSGGARMIAQICGNREIVIAGENDGRMNDKGVWEQPGLKAKQVAKQVQELIGRPVGTWFPPEQYKDIRDMILGRTKDCK